MNAISTACEVTRCFKIEMSGFFKNKTMPTCQVEVESLFNETEYSDLVGGTVQRPGRLRAVYLYSSATKRTISRTFQFTKPGAFAKRAKETKEVAAFHAFGIPDSPHVVVVFQATAAEKQAFLRFAASFAPGDEVWLCLPTPDGNIAQNIVIKSREAILPVTLPRQLIDSVMPPANVSNESYVYFDFLTSTIRLLSAVPQDNVCRGSMCDGQFGDGPCGCTQAPPRKHWALRFTFKCDELDPIANDELSLCSNRLTSTVVDDSVLSWPATDARVDSYDIDDDVSDACLFSLYV